MAAKCQILIYCNLFVIALFQQVCYYYIKEKCAIVKKGNIMKIKDIFICALSALLLCSCTNTANSNEISETVETELTTTTETSVTEEILALNTNTEIVLSTIADEITTTSIQS